MKIVLNDAQQITIQSAEKKENNIKMRIIGMKREEILAVFQNEEKIKRFSIVDDGDVEEFEGYKWEALTEYTGEIYEVSMCSENVTLDERLTVVEQTANDLTLMMAELIGGGEA